MRGEHEGDVERHGCSEFGRQCQHCIDAGACHQIIVKGRCLKSHGQWFYAWFKESCYDAEDAREKLAADKKGFPEQTEVRQDKTRLCTHVLYLILIEQKLYEQDQMSSMVRELDIN